MPTDEQVELQELIESAPERSPRRGHDEEAATPQTVGNREVAQYTDHSQWIVCPNSTFRAVGATTRSLTPDVYTIGFDNVGLYFSKQCIVTDTLIEIDDSAARRVITGIQCFWRAADKFAEHGILFKRGVLLWGPAGSGKTVTVTFLMRDLLQQGGIVVVCQHPKMTVDGLQILRRIEPGRPLIVVLEDIEEIIDKHGEHELLALLDGEHQVANVVNIATTNYPERLGARIVNRPSRFDEVIKIGMPSAIARKAYLTHALNGEGLLPEIVEQWVTDTDGLSIAHLRELVAATQCLGQPYADTLERLRHMKVQPNSGTGNGLGFGVK